jgi:beta-galactosidase/beta-glucuronidase
MLIPDASDEFNKTYDLEKFSHLPNDPNPWKKPYWYRTTFEVPGVDEGRHFELVFKGINYRAAVWLNGEQIADSTQMAGMFAEYSLDVSDHINAGGGNTLAVKIYPLDYPGLPDKEQLEALGDFYLNGGPTGDIGKNVTMLCSVGWDWLPPVRDRNIGIWQPVYLRTSGKVTIEKPQIITDLPKLPDTKIAELSINLSLSNHQAKNEKGKLNVKISPENFKGESIEFSEKVSLKADETTTLSLSSKKVKELNIRDPKLWWPHGYGEQNLYRIQLSFENEDGISDQRSIVTGIRTVSSQAVEVEGKSLRRDFFVNGKRVHLNGGAWVPDMMLQRDSLRLEQELRHCQNANVNLVRIWGGGITPPDNFFNIADRLGLMIWSDFWVTGDTQGEFKGSPDWPLEGSVFIKNITSTIYRIRNHPSLLVWTGGNEGHARKELYDAMRNGIIDLDGTRPFIPSSSGFAKLPDGWKGSWPDDLGSGVYSGGPYTWNPPEAYYGFVDKRSDWVFKDETGLPSQPPYNTLKKIIPNLIWDKTLPFPFNHSWGYHDAATGNGRYDKYFEDMLNRYGAPETMEEFSDKMQLMNAEGYRGIFEAAGHKLNETGGVMLWKLNAAFPSVIWQVYDWYLQPNAGYYFMQKACEPVHIQLNYNDYQVAVVNRTYDEMKKLEAQVKVISLDGKILYKKSVKVKIDATEAKKILPIDDVISKSKEIVFVVLNLTNDKAEDVSNSTYWLSPDNDFSRLSELSEVSLATEIVDKSTGQFEDSWMVKITNESDQLAFFIRPQFMVEGEELQPTYWSDSYFSLAPGSSTTVSVNIPQYLMTGKKADIKISGWNVAEERITLVD